MKSNNRFLEIDALRGFAAISVVIYHYTARYIKLYPSDFDHYFKLLHGNLGVELFFIISGFVIFLTVQKTETPFRFLIKRFIRLYPTYWICLLFSYIITNSYGLQGKETTFYDLLINFSMLQYGLLVPSIDGVYWSLFHELMFYFLIAFSFKFVKTKKLYVFTGLWLILYIINGIYHIRGVNLILNLEYAPLFISGMYFYKLTTEKKKLETLLIPLVSFILYVVFNESIEENIIIFFIFSLFYLNAYGKLKFIAYKPLLFLGSISYALYLIHQNLGYILLNELYAYFGNYQILIIIPLIVSILLAYVITEYLEKPILNYLRKKIN